MVRSKLFSSAFVAGLLALAVACSSAPGSPTSPSSATPGQTTAVGDVVMKTTVPALLAPEHDFAFDSGTQVTLEFAPARSLYVNFAPAYEILIRNNADGQVVYSTTIGASSGNIAHALPPVPTGSYEWQVRTADGDARGAWSQARTFTMKAPVKGPSSAGPRTPNPPPGVRLPAPEMLFVVIGVANQYPQYLFSSCQEARGGTWDFMDTLVDTLRAGFYTRFGYNWKRGVVGDPSMDIVDYNWSGDPDEGTRNVYTFDVLFGHCGSSPSPAWVNTQPGGGTGLSAWTGRGRF